MTKMLSVLKKKKDNSTLVNSGNATITHAHIVTGEYFSKIN